MPPVPSVATIQKALQAVMAPEMQFVKERPASLEGQMGALEGRVTGEIKTLQSEIKRLDDKIDNGLARMDNKIDAGFARLEERIARIDDKLTFTNKRLDEALEIRERLAALEAKVGR